MKRAQIVLTSWLWLAAAMPSQEPTTAKQQKPQHTGVRLTYELPIDALQRSMQHDPSANLEKLLATAIEVVRARLAHLVTPAKQSKEGQATVTRTGPTEFAVELPASDSKAEATAAAIAEVRNLIEMVGTIEFRMLATKDSAGIDFVGERERLQRWLDEGGREVVRDDPDAISKFQPQDGSKLRWLVRVVRPQVMKAGKAKTRRWSYPYHQLGDLSEASVPLYSKAEWNGGTVPAALAKQAAPRLLELLAIDLTEPGFDGKDLDPSGTRVRIGPNTNQPEVLYSIVDKRVADYRNWSAKHIGEASAVITNGRLLTAPVFRSIIPGRGVLAGNFTQAEARALAIALQSGALPAKPKLLRQERAPTPSKRDK